MKYCQRAFATRFSCLTESAPPSLLGQAVDDDRIACQKIVQRPLLVSSLAPITIPFKPFGDGVGANRAVGG